MVNDFFVLHSNPGAMVLQAGILFCNHFFQSIDFSLQTGDFLQGRLPRKTLGKKEHADKKCSCHFYNVHDFNLQTETQEIVYHAKGNFSTIFQRTGIVY